MMYRKEFYAFDNNRPIKTIIRNYRVEDFAALIRIQQESFPPPFPSELWWNEKQLYNHVTLFPEGAMCAEIDGELVGSITSLVVKLDTDHLDHTWEEITDSGYIRNHDPAGDTLYIVDICVRPTYRKLGLGKALMQSMYEVVVHKGLRRLLGGGRMPGYYKKAGEMTADQYLAAVVKGELYDPVITFLLRCGRTPVKVVANYLEDRESCNYAALMEWKNPFFQSSK
ncbi:GCN5-related N-acetyltransferase [Thermosinus carboxydivorans Nor1]|uniref:GCN5-related N-acetyltransferase n=1 Tax=Thermosinus carboxydivorans Nor1 TaxID=401526 RepID=A1HNR1_9FIRM|nr:GNAT family N-acetyltransferase [Thermosinus carboxydivorans]EAX48414.1 GCN5-related N-acetyltransferase [Thermosinus carboxydivorans Nor1]